MFSNWSCSWSQLNKYQDRDAASCCAPTKAMARISSSWMRPSGVGYRNKCRNCHGSKGQVDQIYFCPNVGLSNSPRLADWWDTWKIRLRQILLATTKQARQGLTKSYRRRLHHLYVRLGAARLEARSYDDSPVSAQRGCNHTGSVDTPEELR